MGKCFWIIGSMLIVFLGTSCLWNCLNREEINIVNSYHGCRDQEGNKIDSFILYKLPTDKSSQYSLVKQGLAYVYLMPDSPRSLRQSGGVSSVLSYTDSALGWLLSNISIAHPRSMPGLTLDRLYNDASFMDQALFIMYNDEFPNGTTSFTHGHTKGVVVMTETGGFWLIHSTPKYPPAPPTSNVSSLDPKNADNQDGYNYPTSGTRYGQTFMCVSLDPSQADNIGHQLLHNHPYIYAGGVGSAVKGRFSMLEQVLKGAQPTPADGWFRVSQLFTQKGVNLTSFAKFTKFGKDPYSALVAPTLQTNLLVESWRNGPGPMPSECNSSSYKVENVEQLSVRVSSTSFNSHHDHSKWAVSSNSSKPFVCIGDINRMQSQTHRAGGTLCVWSETIWNRFFKLVTHVQSCPAVQTTGR